MDRKQVTPWDLTGNSREQDGIFQTDNAVIRTRQLDAGHSYDGRINLSEIVFITEGAGYLDTRNLRNVYIAKGMAILLPIGSYYELQVLDDMHAVICALDENVRMTDHFTFEAMFEGTDEKHVHYRPLQMNDKLWQFVTGTLNYMKDGLYCENFLRMKVVEMFHIFRAYYQREALLQFFLPLLTKDARFANFIYDNWASAKTLNDLADMSNLSLSGFTKKFKKVFGVAPYKWIMDKKAERIYADLRSTDKPLRDLASEYNFCSVQHFCDYCKKKFGISPGKLRAKAQKGAIPAAGSYKA
ncbi:MAG: AraC family transcriptional regulator [Alistipes sp.]|nr:AraC family transcriptional regulator [Alistipes sp.]